MNGNKVGIFILWELRKKDQHFHFKENVNGNKVNIFILKGLNGNKVNIFILKRM